MNLGMGVLWAGLVGAPLVGFLFRTHWQGQRRTALFSAASVIFLIGIIFVLGLRFTHPILNICALTLGYTAYAFLVVDGWGISHKAWIIRTLVTTITALPILFGYFLATIGFLALLFIFHDFTGGPRYSEQLAPGIGCEVRLNDGGPSWGTIHVSLHRDVLPFLRWERFHEAIPEEGTGSYSTLCQSAYETWLTR